MLGAKHFARTPLAAEVDGVIVCEPEEGEICAVAKGAVRLRIELTGVMAHGAMPQHARNPLPVGGPHASPAWSGCSSAAGPARRARAPRLDLPDADGARAPATSTQINVIPAAADGVRRRPHHPRRGPRGDGRRR